MAGKRVDLKKNALGRWVPPVDWRIVIFSLILGLVTNPSIAAASAEGPELKWTVAEPRPIADGLRNYLEGYQIRIQCLSTAGAWPFRCG